MHDNRHIHSEPCMSHAYMHACSGESSALLCIHFVLLFANSGYVLLFFRLLLESLQRQCWTVALSTVMPTASLA